MGWQDDPVADEAAKPWENDPEAPTAEAPRPLDGPQLQATHDAVADAVPETQATTLRLVRETGVVPEVVESSPAAIQQQADSASRDWQGVADKYPLTGAHLSDPANMARDKEDIDALAGLENALTGVPGFGIILEAARGGPKPIAYGRRAPGDELRPLGEVEATVEALRRGWAGMRSSLEESRRRLGLDPAWTQILYPFSTSDTEARRAPRQAADDRAAAAELYATSLAGEVWLGAAGALPYMAGFMAAGAIPGGPLAFGALTYYGPVQKRLDELEKETGEKLDPWTRELLAWGVAIPGGAVTAYGFGGIGNQLARPVVARLPAEVLDRIASSTWLPKLIAEQGLRFGFHNARGAASLAAAAALEDVGVQIASGKLTAGELGEAPPLDYGRVWDTWSGTFQSAFKDLALLSAIGPGRQLLHDIGVSHATAREVARLQAARKAARALKLTERDQVAAEALADSLAPGATAYVTRERWDAYWKGQDQDPRVQADFGDRGAAYDAGGEYVAMPLGPFLVRFAKDHADALALDTKQTLEARTPREELARAKDLEEQDRAALEARGKAFEEEKAATAKTLLDSAVAAQVAPETAQAAARLVADFAGAVSLRTGLPVPLAADLAGLHRFRVLAGEQAHDAAHEALMAGLSDEARADYRAARNGDRRAIARLEARSFLDPLTRLFNRAGFEDYRQTRGPTGWDVAIDANDLKAQDLFGTHDIGDTLLRGVADAMRAAAGERRAGGERRGSPAAPAAEEPTAAPEAAPAPGVRLFRVGGDEFHAGGHASREEATAFAERLVAELKKLPELAPGFKASVSIGVGPDIASADRALYRAKDQKAAKYGIFEARRPETRGAVGHGESFVAYADTPEAPPREFPVATVALGKPVTLAETPPALDVSAGLVKTQQRPSGDPIHYRLRWLSELIPSHNPRTFDPNPDFPKDVQERAYHSRAEEQMKVIRGGQELDPALLLANNPTPSDGPAIVTREKPLVMAGTGRTMMAMRALLGEGEAAGKARQKYEAELRARAPGFGIGERELEAYGPGKRPNDVAVVVRELDDIAASAPAKDLAAAMRRFNENLGNVVDPKALAVSLARVLPDSAILELADLFSKAGADTSFRDLMRQEPDALVQILRRTGVITPQTQADWIQVGRFTEGGKDRLEALFGAKVYGSLDRLEQTAPALAQKLERLIGPLLRVEGLNPQASLIPAVQGALDLLNEARTRNLTVAQVVAQVDMFNPQARRASQDAVLMAAILRDTKPRELAEKFRAWADAADPQANLFAGPKQTPEEVRSLIFGSQPREAPLFQEGLDVGTPEGAARWYSNVQRTAASAKQAKGTPDSWWAVLSKGNKAAELEAMGVREWLDSQKGKVLTREEVVAALDARKVTLREAVFGEPVLKDPQVQAVRQSYIAALEGLGAQVVDNGAGGAAIYIPGINGGFQRVTADELLERARVWNGEASLRFGRMASAASRLEAVDSGMSAGSHALVDGKPTPYLSPLDDAANWLLGLYSRPPTDAEAIKTYLERAKEHLYRARVSAGLEPPKVIQDGDVWKPDLLDVTRFYATEQEAAVAAARYQAQRRKIEQNAVPIAPYGHEAELMARIVEGLPALEGKTVESYRVPEPREPQYEDYTVGGHTSGSYVEIVLQGGDLGYSTSHFGEAGQDAMAHARLSEHTVEGGGRVMLIEEIQSDRGQAMQEQGVRNDAKAKRAAIALQQARRDFREALDAAGLDKKFDPAALESYAEDGLLSPDNAPDVGRWAGGTKRTGFALALPADIRALAFQIAKAAQDYKNASGGVPDFPWRDSWERLAVRRLLHYAAEHGFDQVALTPGEVHARRWGTELVAWRRATPEEAADSGAERAARPGVTWEQAREAFVKNLEAFLTDYEQNRQPSDAVTKEAEDARRLVKYLRRATTEREVRVAAFDYLSPNRYASAALPSLDELIPLWQKRAGGPFLDSLLEPLPEQKGWMVTVKGQHRGEVPGIGNLEQAAVARGLIPPQTGTFVPESDMAALWEPLRRAFQGAGWNQVKLGDYYDKIAARMRAEEAGVSAPRAEGLRYAYDKKMRGELEKELKRLGAGPLVERAIQADTGLGDLFKGWNIQEGEDPVTPVRDTIATVASRAAVRAQELERRAARGNEQEGRLAKELRNAEAHLNALLEGFQRGAEIPDEEGVLTAMGWDGQTQRRTFVDLYARRFGIDLRDLLEPPTLTAPTADFPEAVREKILREGLPLFQRGQGQRNLLVQHNLTAENLLHADELGGLAVPSLAVSRMERPATGFGEITLLGPVDLADPTKTPVYNRDLWSARWPETRWKLVGPRLRAVREAISPYAAKVGLYLGNMEAERSEQGPSGTLENRDWRAALALKYLEEKGKPLADITEPVPAAKIDVARQPAMRAFVKEHGIRKDFEAGDEYHRALTGAYRKAVDELVSRAARGDEELAATLRSEHLTEGGFFTKREDRSSVFDEATGLLDSRTADEAVKALGAVGQKQVDRTAMWKAALKAVEKDPGFEPWAREQIAPMFGERYLLKHRDTANGPSWYGKAYTLENVVREMKGGLKQAEGGPGILSGFGNLLAAAAKRFRTLEGMKEAGRKEIVTPETLAASEAQHKDLSDRVADLATELRPYHPAGGEIFRSFDALLSSVTEAFKAGSRGIEAELRRDGFEGVPRELVQKIAGLMQEMRDLPTTYFEAKPQRGVALEEFKAAVVPQGVDPKVVEVLRRRGLEVIPYRMKGKDPHDPANEQRRREAIAAAASRMGLLFQQGPGGPRGVLRMKLDEFGRPVDLPVELLASRDPSTLFHEGGHVLSWAMHDAAMSDRGAALRPDYERLLRWAGFSSPQDRLDSNLERARLMAKSARSPADEARLKELEAREERISHGFEQYLLEGKAPSKALEPVFAKLRQDLTQVYRGLSGVQEQYRNRYGQDLALSDEVRGIFDRWLAAEDETRKAAGELEGDTAAELLSRMDPADRIEWEKARGARQAEAEGHLYAALDQAERADKTDIRKKLRAEIHAQIGEEPVYRLREYLALSGKMKQGRLFAEKAGPPRFDADLFDKDGRPFKLDRDELVNTYGKEFVKALPRGSTVEVGGVTADFLAERMGGFDSGDAMVRALRASPKLDVAVEARTDAKLRELYPNVVDNPAGVVQAAVEAEHTPKAAEEALVAARILVRRVDPSLGGRLKVMEDAATRNRNAQRLILEAKVGDANPQRFLEAERRWARKANELTAKALDESTERRKEFAAQALDARDAQLFNQAMWRAARDVQRKLGSAREYLREAQGDEFRKEIGKATSVVEETSIGPDGQEVRKQRVTQPYLARMDDLLDTLDTRKSAEGSARAQRFKAWLDQQPADKQDDILSRVSPAMLRNLEFSRHWTDLSVQQVLDLRAAVETIAAQAKLKSELRLAGETRDFERAVAAIVADIRRRFPEGGGVRRKEEAQPLGRRFRQGKERGKGAVIRPEELYRELGPELSKVFQTISDSFTEYGKLEREVAEPIVKAIEALSGEDRKFMRQRFLIDGQWLDGEAALVVALSWGNLSNRAKLLRGEAMLSGRFKDAAPITPEVAEALLRELDARPRLWDLVETIWARVGEAKWDEIAALEAEFNGLAPPKIEAAPFERMVDGKLRRLSGGYYPQSYDPRFSTAGQRAGERVAQGVQALAFSPDYERAVTPQGHLIKRIEAFARPVDLSIGAMPRAIVNSMRDLAMRRALVQTRDLLTDPRVRDAILEAKGEDAYRVLTDHWRDTANEQALPKRQSDFLLRWAGRRRTAVTGAVFAANVGLAVQNFANVLPALDQVPVGLVTKAFGRFARERLDMVREVYGLSAYMSERRIGWQNRIQRVSQGLVGRESDAALFAERVREVGMWMMETTDLATAIPVWWAAYEHALRPKGEGKYGLEEMGARAKGLGMTQEQAIKHADQVVRLTQSSYRFLDRSAFERHPVFRHVSLFYGYMNSQLNRFMAAHADKRLLSSEGFKNEARWRIAKSYALLMASGVMADLLVNKGPQDYDQDGEIDAGDVAKWVALRALLYPPSTLPVAGGFLQQIGGGASPRDPSLVPWTRGAGSAIQAGRYAYKGLTAEEPAGDEAIKAGLNALEAVGWYYGLPVVQFRRTGDYWLDITPDGELRQSETSEAAGPGEAAWGSIYGPKKPGSLGGAMFPE